MQYGSEALLARARTPRAAKKARRERPRSGSSVQNTTRGRSERTRENRDPTKDASSQVGSPSAEAAGCRAFSKRRRGSGGTGQAHEPVPAGAGHRARAPRGTAAAVASTVASRGIGSSETASRGARGARGGRRIEEKGIALARKPGSRSPQKVLRERLTEDCIPNPVCLLCTRIPPTSVCCTHVSLPMSKEVIHT